MKLVEGLKRVPDCVSGSPEYGAADNEAIPFSIKRDGGWLYRGTPISRKSMICMFASLLTRDESGGYLLESPVERVQIKVEDAPLVVVGMKWRGIGHEQELSFLTNTDECITAGHEHGLRLGRILARSEAVPYLHVRDGKGHFPIEARISRSTYYELVALAEMGCINGRPALGVWSGGVFFPLETQLEARMTLA